MVEAQHALLAGADHSCLPGPHEMGGVLCGGAAEDGGEDVAARLSPWRPC